MYSVCKFIRTLFYEHTFICILHLYPIKYIILFMTYKKFIILSRNVLNQQQEHLNVCRTIIIVYIKNK